MVLLGIFVVSYVVLNDIVEPKRLGMFENMTIGQRSGFMKILALDVIGIGALLYWIVNRFFLSVFQAFFYPLKFRTELPLKLHCQNIDQQGENASTGIVLRTHTHDPVQQSTYDDD